MRDGQAGAGHRDLSGWGRGREGHCLGQHPPDSPSGHTAPCWPMPSPLRPFLLPDEGMEDGYPPRGWSTSSEARRFPRCRSGWLSWLIPHAQLLPDPLVSLVVTAPGHQCEGAPVAVSRCPPASAFVTGLTPTAPASPQHSPESPPPSLCYASGFRLSLHRGQGPCRSCSLPPVPRTVLSTLWEF